MDITHYYPHLNFFLLVQLSFITQIQKKNQVEAATSYPKGTFLVHKEPPFSFANQEQSLAPRQKNWDNPVLCTVNSPQFECFQHKFTSIHFEMFLLAGL